MSTLPDTHGRHSITLSCDLVIEVTVMCSIKGRAGLLRGRGIHETLRTISVNTMTKCARVHIAMSYPTDLRRCEWLLPVCAEMWSMVRWSYLSQIRLRHLLVLYIPVLLETELLLWTPIACFIDLLWWHMLQSGPDLNQSLSQLVHVLHFFSVRLDLASLSKSCSLLGWDLGYSEATYQVRWMRASPVTAAWLSHVPCVPCTMDYAVGHFLTCTIKHFVSLH